MGWAIAGLVVGWLGWLFVAAPMQMMGLMLVGLVIAGVLLVVSCARSKMCPNKYGDIPNLIGTRGEVSHGAETRAVPLSSVHNSSVMVCPSCGKELRVPATCLGMECECPYCGEVIFVAGDARILHNEQSSGTPLSRFSMVAMVVGIILAIAVVVIGMMVSNRFMIINASGRIFRLNRWTGLTEVLRGDRWVETVEVEIKQKPTGVTRPSVQVKQSAQKGMLDEFYTDVAMPSVQVKQSAQKGMLDEFYTDVAMPSAQVKQSDQSVKKSIQPVKTAP